jgi:hypothetical protein
MSGQLPQKKAVDHPITNRPLNDEEVVLEEDHASDDATFQVSLLHLDSPGSSARMIRAMRLILKPRDALEE